MAFVQLSVSQVVSHIDTLAKLEYVLNQKFVPSKEHTYFIIFNKSQHRSEEIFLEKYKDNIIFTGKAINHGYPASKGPHIGWTAEDKWNLQRKADNPGKPLTYKEYYTNCYPGTTWNLRNTLYIFEV